MRQSKEHESKNNRKLNKVEKETQIIRQIENFLVFCWLNSIVFGFSCCWSRVLGFVLPFICFCVLKCLYCFRLPYVAISFNNQKWQQQQHQQQHCKQQIQLSEKYIVIMLCSINFVVAIVCQTHKHLSSSYSDTSLLFLLFLCYNLLSNSVFFMYFFLQFSVFFKFVWDKKIECESLKNPTKYDRILKQVNP